MVWGAKAVDELSSWSPSEGSSVLLGFNEPNLRKQSNLSAAEACLLWPTLQAAAKQRGFKLGSPAANHCVPGGSGQQDTNCYQGHFEWFDGFFNCTTPDTVDFIATHKYGCNATDTLLYIEQLAARYNKPVRPSVT